MSKKKPVAVFLHSENTAVGLYRIWNPAKALKATGLWEVRELPHIRAVDHFTQSFDSWEELCQGADIIITQRVDSLKSVALLRALGDINNCPVVVDFDDNFFDVQPDTPMYHLWTWGSENMLTATQMMEHATALTVSTQFLKETYAPYNKDITVIHNTQDEEWWTTNKVDRTDPDKIVIGWAGSNSHYADLKQAVPAIKKILKKHPNVVFRVFGLDPDYLKGIERVEIVPGFVEVTDFPEFLSCLGFDIAIAPLVLNDFNLGKSAIKWQEYSMLGIPTVAQKIGEYRRCIIDGETGLLANTETQWYRALDALVTNPELRETLGSNAYEYVRNMHNLKDEMEKYHATYSRIISEYSSR